MTTTITRDNVRLTALRATDAMVFRRWLQGFLTDHNRAWNEAAGLGWSPAETEIQMMATGLVDDHWGRLVRAARSEGQLVRVARVGDRPLGAIWVGTRVDDYLRIPVGALHWVYVSAAARRSGLGMLLIDEGKRWLRSRGVKSVQVHVLADNEPARRLYERAGLVAADVRMMGALTED